MTRHAYNKPNLSPRAFIEAVANDNSVNPLTRARAWDYLAELDAYRPPDYAGLAAALELADQLIAALGWGRKLAVLDMVEAEYGLVARIAVMRLYQNLCARAWTLQ
jgi:hypothetical protein